MRPKIRKVNTNKRKQKRKQAKEAIQRQTQLIASHPTECCVCNLEFKRTKETVKTWQVSIREERVRLTCPNCWGIIKKAVESRK
jgi:hypothetical protein